jgi:hypothetical protein
MIMRELMDSVDVQHGDGGTAVMLAKRISGRA